MEPGQSDLAAAVAQVRARLQALPEDKRIATCRSSTRLVERLSTSAQIRQFELTMDEPISLGGSNRGPNPVEVVLAALGTCQEIVFAVYAAALGIQLDQVEVLVEGDIDSRGFFGVAEVNPGFSEVRYLVRLESPEPPERLRELVEQVKQHCPVLDILQRPLPVTERVEVNGHPLG